jgi:putative spermidine/putrescine transport system permease protein
MARQDGVSTIAIDVPSQALRPDTASGRKRLSFVWLGTLPFFVYTAAFLFVPAGEVMLGAFKDGHGGWTIHNIRLLFDSPYRQAFTTSIQVSGITALAGAAVGLAVGYSAIRDGTPRWIRSVLSTFSGVAANFGGIPLAFAFIATIGTLGIVTNFLNSAFGINPYQHRYAVSYNLFQHTPYLGYPGIELVYLYFQIPLMFLVISPAIDGLKREWRESAANLGASSWQFWRYIGLPVLAPSIMGAVILLFGNAFSAYATAYAINSGIPLVPIIIGAYYTGNVLDNPHLAQALAFGMFVVLALMMIAYIPLNRRAARWSK